MCFIEKGLTEIYEELEQLLEDEEVVLADDVRKHLKDVADKANEILRSMDYFGEDDL